MSGSGLGEGVLAAEGGPPAVTPLRKVPLFGPGPWFAARLALLVALIASASVLVELSWVLLRPSPFPAWWTFLSIGAVLPVVCLAACLALSGPWTPPEVPTRPRLPGRARALYIALGLLFVGAVLASFGLMFARLNERWAEVERLLHQATHVSALWAVVGRAYWNARCGWERPAPPAQRPTPGLGSRVSAWANARMDAFWDGVDRLSDRLRGTR